MKLVFLGSGEIAAACLDALVDSGHAPRLVVTQPPRRRRRRGRPEPTPAQRSAERAGITVHAPGDVNDAESLRVLRDAGADLFVVAEYGQILRKALLAIPPLGAINVHTSLLPRHRGASPVAAAILAGDAVTGISIQRVVRKLDAGPVLARREVSIDDDDDTGSLTRKLVPVARDLLVHVVAAFARGDPPPEEPQDEARATVCRRFRREDGVIGWGRPAEQVWRHVRAFTPRPGAFTWLLREEPMRLVIRRVRPAPGEGAPGRVVRVGADGFSVGCGEGLVRVLELVPAGRKPLTARDFRNGYGLVEGEVLGRP